jgi:hypothetical protein
VQLRADARPRHDGGGRKRAEVVFRAIYTEKNAKMQMDAARLEGPLTFLSDEEGRGATQANRSTIERPGSSGRRRRSRRTSRYGGGFAAMVRAIFSSKSGVAGTSIWKASRSTDGIRRRCRGSGARCAIGAMHRVARVAQRMTHARRRARRDDSVHELRARIVREIPVAHLVVGLQLLVQVEDVHRRPLPGDPRLQAKPSPSSSSRCGSCGVACSMPAASATARRA